MGGGAIPSSWNDGVRLWADVVPGDSLTVLIDTPLGDPERVRGAASATAQRLTEGSRGGACGALPAGVKTAARRGHIDRRDTLRSPSVSSGRREPIER